MAICPNCSGSGEGFYPGTICHACKGLGEVRRDDYDPDDQEDSE